MIEAASAFNSPLASINWSVSAAATASQKQNSELGSGLGLGLGLGPGSGPMLARDAYRAASFPGLFSTSGCRGVVIDVVKLAEDASGDVVLRLVETGGSRGVAELSSALPIASAVLCTMDEEAFPDGLLIEIEGNDTHGRGERREHLQDIYAQQQRRIGSILSPHSVVLGFEPFKIVTIKLRLVQA